MKLKKITTNEIKDCHPSNRFYQTDQYYQRLANRLQDSFCSLGLTDEEHYEEVMHRAAIMLTNYMEDIVADSGLWRAFSNLCQELYGFPVPLFHEDEEYFADEPSLSAIRFLLWCTASDASDEFVVSDSESMERMAIAAYDILEEAFEEAPVNEQLVEDIVAFFQYAAKGFNQLRSVLTWLFFNCYLTSGEQSKKLFSRHLKNICDLTEDRVFPDMEPGMGIYYATVQCLFPYRIGPLALYPKDYLAAMMRTKGMERQAEEVAGIEYLAPGTYKYEPVKPDSGLLGHEPHQDRLRITRTNGKQFDIETEELNLTKEQLKRFYGFMASSFVFYQGEWRLNGLLFPFTEKNKKWKELCEDDPENLKPGTTTFTAEMMLERTDGQQIAYFADHGKMKDFLEKKLRFPHQMLDFGDEHEGDFPALFIDKEEPRDCLHFFFDYSRCIADPSNPFYDKNIAREKAINMLWDADAVSTHAVKYLLEHNFLPDIYNEDVLSKRSSTEEKRHDIDFLMRFYRRENY